MVISNISSISFIAVLMVVVDLPVVCLYCSGAMVMLHWLIQADRRKATWRQVAILSLHIFLYLSVVCGLQLNWKLMS